MQKPYIQRFAVANHRVSEAHHINIPAILMTCQMQGREEGGSGVSLDKEAYEKSVAYWDLHAAILVGQEPSGE